MSDFDDDYIGDDDISRAILSGDPFNDGDRIDVPIVTNNGAWVDIAQRRLPSGVAGVPDDFSQLLQDQFNAQNMPGVGPVDDLAASVRLREIQERRRNERSPRVDPIPRSFDFTPMGNVVDVESGQLLSALQWTGDTDSEARELSLSVFVAPRIDGGYPAASGAAGTFSYRPYLALLFGTRTGGIVQVECDVGRGLRLNLGGSYVGVSIGMRSAPSGRVAGKMRIAATLSQGSKHTTAPVTYTAYVDSLAAAGTQSIVIPAFAQRLLPLVFDDGQTPGTGQAELAYRDTNNVVIGQLDLGGQGSQIEPWPVPNDAYSLLLSNTGAKTCTYRLIWELAL